MKGLRVRMGRTRRVLVFWAAVLVLAGCAALPARVQPPRAPAGAAGTELKAAPADIALSRSDLPAGFQLVAEKSSGPEYVALYLRPSALEDEASGGNKLLSVMTSIGVYTSTLDAEQVYVKATANPEEQKLEEAALVSRAGTEVKSQPFTGAAQGADASEAFRVSYRLMEQNVFEYGYRFRLGNVLAHVVVAAIGTPDEPANLLRDARDLVQRQIDHIVAAGGSRPAS